MSRLLHLELATDFFNGIGQKQTHALQHHRTVKCVADSMIGRDTAAKLKFAINLKTAKLLRLAVRKPCSYPIPRRLSRTL
jgi:hypothetical protein